MSQDIRSFFSRVGGSKSPSAAKTPEPSKKSRKRYIVDSDSEDDFQSPKNKKNKSSKVKSNETTPKSNKKASPKKKGDTTSKYFEVNKTTVESMFGKEPVKRSALPPKKQKKTSLMKMLDGSDDDDFETALLQMEDAFQQDNVTSDSIAAFSQDSGLHSPGPLASQTSMFNSSATTPGKDSPKKDLHNSNKKESPIEIKSPISSSKRQLIPEIADEEVPKNGSGIRKRKDDEVMKIKKQKIEVTAVSPKRKVEVKKEVKVSPVKREAPLVSGLWVDKYKPANIKQIIGQQGDKSNVNKLLKWLRNWHLNQSGGKKIPRPSPWAKDDSGAYFKAALLSGPPGVGKTTTAHLVCKELEMDVVEFNASDTRSKKLLNQEVGQLLSSMSLSPFFTAGGGEVTARHVLLMDEVDGMAGNEDRGGVQELIQLIKSSRVPVICMCNDRNHPKIRSLANYCFDLRFSRPRADQIKGAMLSVCFREKLKVKPEILMDIITNSNQDIRLVLNHLSMLATSSNDNMKASSKDIKIGPWDVLKQVFSEEAHKKMSIHDKSDLFFHDYNIASLFVQENYLNVVPHSPASKTKVGKMELFARAAESLANGDLVERAIRSSNAWSLLPTQAMFSSLVPGDVLEGHVGGPINFPLWLGKNSRKNKMDRLTQEIQAHTRLRMSGSKEDVGLDYARALLDSIVRPMSQDGSEGTESSLRVLREYSLLREDLDSLSQLTDWGLRPDPFTRLDPKVKAAFTRAYNKCPVLSPFAQVTAVKKKSKRGADDQEWGSDEEAELSDQPEDDDITNDAMIMVKKKTEKKSEKKGAGSKTEPSTSSSSKRGARGGKRGRK